MTRSVASFSGLVLTGLAFGAAGAQSLVLDSGTLYSDGLAVAELDDVELSVQLEGANLQASYADSRIALTGALCLDAPNTRLLAHVGEDTTLRHTAGWRATLLAGGCAPVVNIDRQGTLVALPRDYPVRTARIPAGAAPLRKVDVTLETRGPWCEDSAFPQEDAADNMRAQLEKQFGLEVNPDLLCRETRGPCWTSTSVEPFEIVSIGPARRWATVTLTDYGIRLEGLARLVALRPPYRVSPTPPGAVSVHGRGTRQVTACGQRRVVQGTLRAETELYAHRGASMSFARLKTSVVAQLDTSDTNASWARVRIDYMTATFARVRLSAVVAVRPGAPPWAGARDAIVGVGRTWPDADRQWPDIRQLRTQELGRRHLPPPSCPRLR